MTITKLRRWRQRKRQKSNRFNGQKNNHAFLYISLQSLHNYTWNDQILSLIGNGNEKAINSTISARTWVRSLLFSSNPNSLLLSNWAPWNNREKKWKDAKSIFQRRFHGRRRCRIVRSLITVLRALVTWILRSNSAGRPQFWKVALCSWTD